MENDNLLKRCETLEADFNALDTYIGKRDLVIQLDKDFENDIEAKNLFNDFHNFNESNLPCPLNPKHNSPVVSKFSSKLKGNRKIKFDAFYKAIELLEIEFKKIEPKLIIEIAAEIIIEIHIDDIDNDYKELRKFANLLIQSPHHAQDKFFTNRIDLVYCRNLQMKIYENYLFEPYISIFNGYIDIFRHSIYNNTFFNYYKIDNEALAAKLKEYINTILNDESPPPTASKNSANEIKVELQKLDNKLSGEIGKLKQEIKETPPQRIIIKEVQQNKKAIPTPTTKTPTVENNKPYKPHKYQPCTYFTHTNQKVTYLIGIGELDTIIANNNNDKKEVLKALKKLSFVNENGEDIKVFSENDFGGKERYQDEIKLSDNIGIFKNVGDYIKYRNEDNIPSNKNYPITAKSIEAVENCLKKDIFKNLEITFNANLKY